MIGKLEVFRNKQQALSRIAEGNITYSEAVNLGTAAWRKIIYWLETFQETCKLTKDLSTLTAINTMKRGKIEDFDIIF